VHSRLAYALLLLVPGLWSANMIVARWAAGWFPPHALAFWRWVIALLPMLLLCGAVLWRRRAELRREWKDLLLLGALGMWVCGAFVYIAGAAPRSPAPWRARSPADSPEGAKTDPQAQLAPWRGTGPATCAQWVG
jgi:drug/metabolite transporter (DMT)-like permease